MVPPKAGVILVLPKRLPVFVPAGLALNSDVLLPNTGAVPVPKVVVAGFPKADCPKGLL